MRIPSLLIWTVRALTGELGTGEADVQSAATLLLVVGRPYMWEASAAIYDLWPPSEQRSDDAPSFSAKGEPPVPPPAPQPTAAWPQRTGRHAAKAQPKEWKALLWSHAYVELLQRHRLHTLAIRVAHLSDCDVIQKLNKERVHVKAVSKCLQCRTELPTTAAGEAASRCNVCSPAYANARCSVCRLPVRGAWVWCQGCGHGGHLQCYERWFAGKAPARRLCPTGCNHQCELGVWGDDQATVPQRNLGWAPE